MSTVLDHHQDPNYEPSQTEIVEYGKWLGMELPADEPLLWIAREGLKAPLPDHWKACKSEKGELYYFNFKTGQSIWDHPLDEHYKQLFKNEKTKLKEDPAPTEKASSKLPPSGKKAATAAPLSSGPLAASTSQAPSTSTTATPTSATHSIAMATAMDDDATSTTSADSSTKRGGKLAALKTLKVRKEVPEELRIDAVANGSSAPNSTIKSTSSVLTPQSTNHTPQSILVPAVKAVTKTPTPQQLPVEYPDEAISSSVASKFSPISTIDTPSNVMETTATTTSILKQKPQSFQSPSNEQLESEHKSQLAALQRQHQEAIEEKRRSYQIELKKFQSEEQQRIEKERDELTHNLDAAMKKTKTQLRQRHEQQVQALQKELDGKLHETQKRLEEEYHTAKKRSAENHSQRMSVLVSALQGEAPLLLQQDAEKLLSQWTTDVANWQAKFADQVKSATDTVVRVKQEEAQAELEAALRSLKSEEQAATLKLREVVGECNAKITVTRMECEAKLQDLKLQLAEEKSSLLDAHRIEMAALSTELKAQQRQALVEAGHRSSVQRSPSNGKQKQMQDSPKPRQASSRHDDPLSTGSSDMDDDEQLLPPPLPQNPPVVVSEVSKQQPAPLSTSAFLAASAPTPNNNNTPTSIADLRTLMTDVLRELFQGSPFIVPSPGSQPPSKANSPVAHAARGAERVSMTAPDPNVPVEIIKTQSIAMLPSVSSTTLNQSQVIPDSYKEQQSLVSDERRRLEEGKLFVATQRASLEERRAQLKTARRHWKADVMAAKAQGVQSNSKKGQLLHKVHRVLDKQAAGLEHDDNLLKDSEQWLKTKEQRLLRLESQMAEQHERSRHGQLDISSCSIDTTALFTGYFKPNVAPDVATRNPSPGARLDSNEVAAVEEHLGPTLSKALERIERRIDRVATMVSERPSTAPPLKQEMQASIRQSTAALASSSRGAPAAAPVMSASSRGRTSADVLALSSRGKENHNSNSMRGKADPLSSSNRAGREMAASTRGAAAKESATDAVIERPKSSKRSSRSNSRHRHVDFATNNDMFADPWSEVIAA